LANNITIVFSDYWVDFSPSLLNTVSYLREKEHEIKLIFIGRSDFSVSKIIKKVDCDALILPRIVFRAFALFRCLDCLKCVLLIYLLIKNRKFSQNGKIIAFDSVAYIATFFFDKKKRIYYSLEVKQSLFTRLVRFVGVNTIIIQSKERNNYLNIRHEAHFFVQNSPRKCLKKFEKNSLNRRGLLFFGNVKKEHGVLECIEASSLSAPLTIKSMNSPSDIFINKIISKYTWKIKEGSLVIIYDYFKEDELLEFIQQFEIGLCFYDLKHKYRKDFNYLSSPSGKIFSYLSAGVPVISSPIIGLESLVDRKAVIFIDDITPSSIVAAVDKIRNDYKTFSEAAQRAGCDNNFDNGFSKFYSETIVS
jgi:glycosyltransferase involved in cell wall biosynthesis